MIETITLTKYKCTCERCGHTWTTTADVTEKPEPPTRCANRFCNQTGWNEPAKKYNFSAKTLKKRANSKKNQQKSLLAENNQNIA